MKQELITLAKKAHVFLLKGQLATNHAKDLTSTEIATLRANKPEIIEWLKEERRKKIEEEENKKREEYAHLIAKLPERTFENTPDQEKFDEIMSKISNRYFNGPEDDGLNLAVSAGNARIRSEARQYCAHEIKEDFHFTHTADARKKVVRTFSCSKCGLHIEDRAEEDISIEAMWR